MATFVIRRQLERYRCYNKIRYYRCKKGAIEKKLKTVYIDDEPFYACTETGEILRRKRSDEVIKCFNDSISRTRKTIKEILLSNNWQWFVTLTFNDREQNRSNDFEVKKSYDSFRRYLRRQFADMIYFCVPERHKSGAMHFHMLLSNISAKELMLLESGLYSKGKKRIRSSRYDKLSKENKKGYKKIYNILAWKYGFSTVTEIESQAKVSSYVLKYVGKELGNTTAFKKRYWVSSNCNRAEKETKDLYISQKSRINVKTFSELDLKADNDIFMLVEYYCPEKNYIVYIDYNKDRDYKKSLKAVTKFKNKYLSWYNLVMKKKGKKLPKLMSFSGGDDCPFDI